MKDKLSIVIADENNEVVEEIQKVFGASQFDIVARAKDGEELINLAKKFNPDVIIMDFVLPKKDGFSVIEELNANHISSKIVAHTALSMDTFVNKAMKMGVKYYAIKPFDLSILKERVLDIFSETEMNSNIIKNEKENHNPNQMEEKITNIFITVGIPAHIKGYQFLREAIKLAIANPEIINSITKKLYPTIADKFDTSASKVERAIRHAIEVAWNRGKIENINNLFGLKVYSSNEKPTNGEFIALVADKMLIEGA